MEKQSLLLYRVNNGQGQTPWKALGRQYALRFAQNLNTAISYLTDEHIECIVTEFPATHHPPIEEIFYFRSCFQTIPILIHGITEALATSKGLVDNAIRFIPHESFSRLAAEIPSLIRNYSFIPDLSVFGISLEQCPPRIKKALGIIQKDFLNRNLSVNQIAFQLNVNRCHFEREFHHYCRISPKQLILGLKLLFACFLMKNEGMKLLHIAPFAGFPDYYEFSKLFSKHLGMPPKAFRQTCSVEEFSRHFSATKPQ